MNRSILRTISIAALLVALIALSTTAGFAQSAKVEGIIKGRSGSQVILQTADSPKVVVLLTDTTDVAQVEGALKARNKKMSMAALIPGLPIQVEGSYNAKNEMVASKIRFKGDDFEQAQAIRPVCMKPRCRPKRIRRSWKSRTPLWPRRTPNCKSSRRHYRAAEGDRSQQGCHRSEYRPFRPAR